MKVGDLTQFYSPFSGGVRRYLDEKRRFCQQNGHEHVLIVPGPKTETIKEENGRTYVLRAPLVTKNSRYRALFDFHGIEQILERESLDVLETSDPYQIGWKALASGEALRVPVVGFYHSHFPEAYLRTTAKFFGQTATYVVMEMARHYVRALYSRFRYTFVPSEALAAVLTSWGVDNTVVIELGVRTDIFRPEPDKNATRAALQIPASRFLLLYVGRLGPEKNLKTLLRAFSKLYALKPGFFHLLVVGDGIFRDRLMSLQKETQSVTWLRYCAESAALAKLYRAADLFVHPSVQETFGLVALESQACGVPVIGIRGSYLDRIIVTDQSCWAAENTGSSLAEAILATTQEDLLHLGTQASERIASRYSWQSVFRRMFDIYERIGI
jgi:alpha-1,6-mannosyltransferase